MLEQCSSCGNQIEESAESCPYCGANYLTRHPISGLFGYLVMGVIGFALAFFCLYLGVKMLFG